VCLYFKLHQPVQLRKFTIFDIGKNQDYFNNKSAIKHIAKKVYQPANNMILRLLEENINFKVSYVISGNCLEQLQQYCPDVINSFKKLVETGKVELLSQPFYSSLSYFYSKKEFKEQIKLHNKKIKELFNYKPKGFVTDLNLTKDLIKTIESLGYKTMLIKNNVHNQNFIYKLKDSKIKILLKNTKLSEDVNYRFSNQNWKEWPLTTEKYVNWINKEGVNSQCINIFLDYESLGLYHTKQSKILSFISKLPEKVLRNNANDFKTPLDLINLYNTKKQFKFNKKIPTKPSGNILQIEALQKLYDLETPINKSQNKIVLDLWRKLQTTNFHHMSKKLFTNNPHGSPYEAFINFMNILEDLNLKLNKNTTIKPTKKPKTKPKISNEKLNKDQIKTIKAEKQEEIIKKLKEVYKVE